MWGAIAGAALSTLGSLWGGNQAAKAEQRKKRYVEGELKDNENWWRRALARIKAALRQLGFNVKFTDADINYLLWKAEDKLRAEGRGVFDRAEDISRRSQAEREAREETRRNAENVLSKEKGQKAIGGMRGEETSTVPDMDMDMDEPLAARGDEGEGDTRYRVGNKRRAEMERRLDKRRPDLSQEEKEALFDYLDGIDDTKVENATFDWFVKGTIRIPEDMDKVRQAVEVAGKAKVDPAKYNSPMELLNANANFKPTKPRINPDDVPTLTNKKDYGNGITVYDVDESEDSRRNMRAIIDTHWGEDANPWCLLAKDPKTGEFYPGSEGYWNETYNAYGKKVAFKDGKLLAFFASDGQPTWWDRNDRPHGGIPVTGKMRGDKEGRSATYEYKIPVGDIVGLDDMHSLSPDDPTGDFDRDWKRNYGDGGDWGEPKNIHKGSTENGKYEEWYDNGQKKKEFNYKNGEANGECETWYANGALHQKGFMKNGKGEGHYEEYYEDGSIQRKAEFRDGTPIRDENFYHDGQLESESGLKDGKGGYWKKAYYSNGQLEQHDYWDDKGFYHQIYYHGNGQKSFESTSRGGSERYGDKTEWYENGQIKEKCHYNDESELDGEHVKYSEDGRLQFREFYKDGKREGLQERWGIDNYILERVNYKNGRKEGVEEQYFHHDIFHPERRVPNVIRVRREYKDGVLDGVEEEYWLNGSLHNFVEYKDGQENGVFVKWNEDGTLFSYSEYKDAKMRGFAAHPIAGQKSAWHFYEMGMPRDKALPTEEGEKMLAERMKAVEEKVAKANERLGDEETRFREAEETNELAEIIANSKYEKKELNDREREELKKVNDAFNEKLSTLTEANADEVYLSMGKPSSILRGAGVHDKEMKLYGNKIIKKVRKHGFGPQELRNLVENTADPIAVFNNKGVEGNRSILTELRTKDGNFLVTIDLGKGVDVDFNIVTSVFGKGDDRISNWLKKGYDTYINKEKALNYLYYPAPIAETPRSPRLDSEGKGNENFGTAKENREKNGENLVFREAEDEEPREVRRAAIYGKDRRTGETRYVDYSRTGDEVREIERDVVEGVKERHPELKLSSAERTQETNSAYRTITFPNGSVLKIRFSDHTPGRTAKELDDDRVNFNGINWTHTGRNGENVEGHLDISRNRMTADDVVRFVDRMAEYDRDGYPEEMQRLIEENKEKIKNEHRGWLAPLYYMDERITKAFGEDVEPLGANSEKGNGWLKSLPLEKLEGREPVVVEKPVIVDVEKHKNLNRRLRGDELKEYRKKALKYATDNNLFGTYVNESNGHTEITFDRTGKGETKGGLNELLHKAKTAAEIEAAMAVPELIKHGVYKDSADNFKKKKKPDILKYHYYLCGLKIGDENYVIHMNISEDKDGNRYYDHQVIRQKKNGSTNEPAHVSSPEVSSEVQMSEAANNEPANRGAAISYAPTSRGKGSENFGNTKENGENILFRTEKERPSGPLREGEGIFDRAEAVSRDYLAELDRSRKEALAAKPKSHCADAYCPYRHTPQYALPPLVSSFLFLPYHMQN